MHLAFIAALLTFTSSPPLAFAQDAKVGVYYFSGDGRRVASVQEERGEEGQTFPAPRDPRQVARDLGRMEMAQGNVCLRQMQKDLAAALASKKIQAACSELYGHALSEARAKASRGRAAATALECEAAAEVREASGRVSVALSFRGKLTARERVPEKLARAGIRGESEVWHFPVFEAPLGEAVAGWKGALQAKLCSLDDDLIQSVLDKFRKQAKAESLLLACRGKLESEAASLRREQDRLGAYVPEEWLAAEAGRDLPHLLSVPTLVTNSREDCERSLEAVNDRAERLQSLMDRVASKHDLPALKDSLGRVPASMERED